MRHRLVVVTLGLAYAAVASAPVSLQAGGLARRAAGRTSVDPFSLISRARLVATVHDLTAIQAYSGWRNSGTEGEAEALTYMEHALAGMQRLQRLGVEVRRQPFRVFLATELWESRLWVTVGGSETEVPANGLRGPRESIATALRFDSDGTLNDSERDPVEALGPVALVRTARDAGTVNITGKIVFVSYAVVDRVVRGFDDAVATASQILDGQPAAVVLVTRYSNTVGQSHGTFAGDVSAFNSISGGTAPPVLIVRLEDLAAAGVATFQDLGRVTSARLRWDADVFSPGSSANVIARIPGRDSSRSVILGAHIDSPNSPGALDDGSGSAVLLEVARVINGSQTRPPVDLYLVWFGSEELGLYGSYTFVASHQELLDRTVAMLQVDCLSHPLDGVGAVLELVTWPYERFGHDDLEWPWWLRQAALARGASTSPVGYLGVESDNSGFSGFDVPNANLIYDDGEAMAQIGGVHYAGHLHDPYDTVERVEEEVEAFEGMARVALTAALEVGRELPVLRSTPAPDRRAVIVGSHTEPAHMSPTTFTDFGMALAWEGFDVDLLPYGTTVTQSDLEDADLVVVLPVLDYPSPDGDPGLYDEAWTGPEADALEAYVRSGGLLVLTASAHRLKYFNRTLDDNEDRDDQNLLGERFGVTFGSGTVPGQRAVVLGQFPLVAGMSSFELAAGNAVPYTAPGAQRLAAAGGTAVVSVLQAGAGEVIVLGDVGILGTGNAAGNMPFWRNLADHAR